MNVFKTWKRFQSLSPEQKRFLREKRIQASRDRAAWIGFLSPVAAVDRGLDGARRFLAWSGGLLIPPAVIGAFAMESPLPLLLLPVSAALFAIWGRLKRLDLPASPARFLLPLLTLLQEETAPGTAISLSLDLRGYWRDDKVVKVSGPAADRLTFYKDAWVSSTFVLGDGSRLHWEIADIVRSRERQKRGSSGKMKWKTKIKVRRTIDVRLQAKTRDYRLDASNPEVPSPDLRVKIKAGENRNDIRIRKRYAPPAPDTPPALNDLIDAVAEAYRRLEAPEAPPDKPRPSLNPMGAQ